MADDENIATTAYTSLREMIRNLEKKVDKIVNAFNKRMDAISIQIDNIIKDVQRAIDEEEEDIDSLKNQIDLTDEVNASQQLRFQSIDEEISELKDKLNDGEKSGTDIERESYESLGSSPDDSTPSKLEPKYCSCGLKMWLDMISLYTGVWKCECGNQIIYEKEPPEYSLTEKGLMAVIKMRLEERGLIAVEKADLEKWKRFVGEAVMEEEFVIDEFEEMLREISKYLTEVMLKK